MLLKCPNDPSDSVECCDDENVLLLGELQRSDSFMVEKFYESLIH